MGYHPNVYIDDFIHHGNGISSADGQKSNGNSVKTTAKIHQVCINVGIMTTPESLLVVWNTKCYLNTESKFCNRGFVTLYVNNEVPKALVLKTLIPNADSF